MLDKSNIGIVKDCSFYDVGGNVTQHYHLYLPNGTQIDTSLDSLRPQYHRRAIGPSTPQKPQVLSVIAKPNALDVVQYAFRTIDALVKPYRYTVFKKLDRDLQELEKVVALSYIAYQACRGSEIGSVVARQMDKQIQHCADTLTRVQTQITAVVRVWLSIWDSASTWMPVRVANVLNRYWEPPDIASIRVDIVQQTEMFGLCLSALKSFHWMNQLLRADDSCYSLSELQEFFRAGLPSLRHLRAEEIIIVEPLGDRLHIPVCFIDSIEHIHLYLQEACRKTKGGRYIDNKEYQLDEMKTNQVVESTDLARFLRSGTVLEVTVIVSAVQKGVGLSQCPRPECRQDNSHIDNANGWVRCTGCRFLFKVEEFQDKHKEEKARFPDFQSPFDWEDLEHRIPEKRDTPNPRGESFVQQILHPEWSLFRRIKVGIQLSKDRSAQQEGHSGAEVEDESWFKTGHAYQIPPELQGAQPDSKPPKPDQWDELYLGVLYTQDWPKLRYLLFHSNPSVIMPLRGPLLLSQAAILTLVHRLSIVINETPPNDDSFKPSLWWLERSVATLRPEDKIIIDYIPRVLPYTQQLLNSTKQRWAILPGGGPNTAGTIRALSEMSETLRKMVEVAVSHSKPQPLSASDTTA